MIDRKIIYHHLTWKECSNNAKNLPWYLSLQVWLAFHSTMTDHTVPWSIIKGHRVKAFFLSMNSHLFINSFNMVNKLSEIKGWIKDWQRASNLIYFNRELKSHKQKTSMSASEYIRIHWKKTTTRRRNERPEK